MCHLKQIQFCCGHSRKELLQACPANPGLAPTGAPAFCASGLQVIETVESDRDCGHVTAQGISCFDSASLKAIQKQVNAFHIKLNGQSQRVQKVRNITDLIADSRLEPNWDLLREQGCAFAMMKNQLQMTNFAALFEKWDTALISTRQEVNIALAMTRKLLHGLYKRIAIEPTGGLEQWVHRYINGDLNKDEYAIPTVLKTFQTILSRADFVVENLLQDIESAAVLTGLDSIGWVVPEDAREKLKDDFESRLDSNWE